MLRLLHDAPPILGHRKGGVDETFFLVQHAALPKLVGDVGENPAQNRTRLHAKTVCSACISLPSGPARLCRLRWSEDNVDKQLRDLGSNYAACHRVIPLYFFG